jgi:hypothetical protein
LEVPLDHVEVGIALFGAVGRGVGKLAEDGSHLGKVEPCDPFTDVLFGPRLAYGLFVLALLGLDEPHGAHVLGLAKGFERAVGADLEALAVGAREPVAPPDGRRTVVAGASRLDDVARLVDALFDSAVLVGWLAKAGPFKRMAPVELLDGFALRVG